MNPNNSVLIVTIDEKEHLRLGMLLEQLFPGSKVQMVTVVINAPGQARRQELARVNEFAFFVFLGAASPVAGVDDLLNEKPSGNPKKVRWESLLRSGTNSLGETDQLSSTPCSSTLRAELSLVQASRGRRPPDSKTGRCHPELWRSGP
ncbi:MAG: hypothetical protein R2710_24815 [Acidimicrobiales bacterium]